MLVPLTSCLIFGRKNIAIEIISTLHAIVSGE